MSRRNGQSAADDVDSISVMGWTALLEDLGDDAAARLAALMQA